MSHNVNQAGIAPGSRHHAAAQYVRMSTELQRYSIDNQAEAIGQYAAARGLTIVRSYTDFGKSGLDIEGRPGLRQLLSDVQDGNAPFKVLLVYDISRWGRFQDTDESAFYEYSCKKAGVHVAYCAEPFENDGTPLATVLKSLKRAMAGEYSRELSKKVFIGQCRIAELGFNMGGSTLLGMRRMLVDENGMPKGVLNAGERKSIASDRVVLAPGPPAEVALIRQIFRLFSRDGLTFTQISRVLNSKGIKSPTGANWRPGSVKNILLNEKYTGTYLFNKSSQKLNTFSIPNPPEMWIRKSDAFKPIISANMFEEVATKITLKRTHSRLKESEMLLSLEELFSNNGFLSKALIDAEPGMPSSHSYCKHFGCLNRAYSLVGYSPYKLYSINNMTVYARRHNKQVLLGKLRALLEREGTLSGRLIDAEPDMPSANVFIHAFCGLRNAYALVGFTPEHWLIRRRRLAGSSDE